MYASPNFKTKKALKEAVKEGRVVTVFQPGPFSNNAPTDGVVFLEGPNYVMHRWYAEATLQNGRVVKVK